MRLPRIYVETALSEGAILRLPADSARHLTHVLRRPAGTPLALFNGDGRDYPAQLVAVDRGGATVRVGPPRAPEPSAPLEIHLALGISKGERMDHALQKSVELGVTRVTPLFTERTQIQLAGPRLQRRLDHWRGIVIAACEQCGRSRLPVLVPATPYSNWLTGQPGGGLLLDPEAPRSLAALPAPGSALTLLVGPEGGLSAGERERARAHGFEGVHLGPRILRTETAPLAAVAIIQALWGDLRGPHPTDDPMTASSGATTHLEAGDSAGAPSLD
ncbi:MAG: 16S rRNA (uracil(1498)-N(3))-methyltransferase [Thiocapsa sp.]|jgi:16S rRNA (uracil1498-N3)-methyltransferase|nr:16S rRNA (uracil(1498)-N(3))-methyltransferase [Thiocapsa sp.]MCG6896722.1 16S rRNA (uracil(1498)-N(3))-methyltransferase [Thiocapsa sp.]MCG6984793.1 16S rRNA (uracil(1498)-N(3))-methyltransferase [Thiocapsa sp.]